MTRAPIVLSSVLWGIVLGACSSCGAATPPASPHPAVASPPGVEPAYDVHEWGLMRGTAGDSLTASAVAPPVLAMPISVDKPVLYFHAEGPLTLRSVEVHAEGGTIEEYWPPTPRTSIAADLGWFNVAIAPGEACTFTPLPRGCPTEAFCEVPSLAVVRVPGADCVHTREGDDSMLFYRARQNQYTPPLVFERTSVYEQVSVRNDGDDPIPGWLIRLRSHFGQVVALAIRPPAPHTSIVVSPDFEGAEEPEDGELAIDVLTADEEMPGMPGSYTPGRRAVELSLEEIGLTPEETAAFLRAWDESLFGLSGPSDGRGATDETALDGVMAPAESFLYFLPPSGADAVATLTFDPPPRHVARAMAMWSTIPASGPSR